MAGVAGGGSAVFVVARVGTGKMLLAALRPVSSCVNIPYEELKRSSVKFLK